MCVCRYVGGYAELGDIVHGVCVQLLRGTLCFGHECMVPHIWCLAALCVQANGGALQLRPTTMLWGHGERSQMGVLKSNVHVWLRGCTQNTHTIVSFGWFLVGSSLLSLVLMLHVLHVLQGLGDWVLMLRLHVTHRDGLGLLMGPSLLRPATAWGIPKASSLALLRAMLKKAEADW